MRLLIHTDSPARETGFGNVCRELVNGLHDLFQIDVVGVNHLDYYPGQDNHPCTIYPAFTVMDLNRGVEDPHGWQHVTRLLRTNKYDWFISVLDHFNYADHIYEIRSSLDVHNTKWIGYFPVDSYLRPKWCVPFIQCEYPVFYTNYGINEVHKLGIKMANARVIYHGTDTEVFKPLDRDKAGLRRSLFKGHPDIERICSTDLFISVNKNQIRKNYPHLIREFARYFRKTGRGYLYLHTEAIGDGCNVHEVARDAGLPKDRYFVNHPVLSQSQLNALYNCADCFITTTYGEGWGLSISEATAAGIPVIAPDNTVIREVSPHALLVKNDHEVCMGAHDLSRFRPAGGDYVREMLRYAKANTKANLDHIRKHTWAESIRQFREIML